MAIFKTEFRKTWDKHLLKFYAFGLLLVIAALQLAIELFRDNASNSGKLAIHSQMNRSTSKPSVDLDKCPKEYDCPFPRHSSAYTNEHHYLATNKCCEPYRSLKTVNDSHDTMQTYKFPAHQLRFIGPHKVNCDANTELFIAIKSKFSNHVRRQNVRSTWMSKHNCTPIAERNPRFCEWVWQRTKVAFFVSIPKSTEYSENLAVIHELHTYGDVVQTTFVEHYHNMTLKTVSSMYWAALHCWQAKYVVSTDDDVHLYLPRLWMTIMSAEGDNESLANWLTNEIYPTKRSKLFNSALFFGSIRYNAPVSRGSTYATSLSAYLPSKYPAYFYGWFAVLSRCVVESIVRAAMCDNLLWIDDVYLFGILPEALSLPRRSWKDFFIPKNRSAALMHYGKCDDNMLIIIEDHRDKQVFWSKCS